VKIQPNQFFHIFLSLGDSSVKKATTDNSNRERTGTAGAAADVFPSPVYRRTVLEKIFRDAKRYFLEPLLAVQFAHTLMLAKQKIIPADGAARCLRALEKLNIEEIRRAPYDPGVEDLYFFIEKKLTDLCGAENAGLMPTARSRNDVDMTMYRMVLRSHVLAVSRSLLALRQVLVNLAWSHRASLVPAYTHQQPAQPTTLGHYLMAAVEWMERDIERLQAAYERLNRSPLGACAVTTTGFPIDRGYTAWLLGFEGLQLNSYGAIASVDYMTEACSALMVSMVNLGRFTQDLLQWSTSEFAYLSLSDAYVQTSSIMPQKRNPVALEHVRILASKTFVQAQGVLISLHNTPFADMNDAEDDLQPFVYSAFADAVRSLDLLAGLLETATFDTERMQQRTHANFLTVTELADVLVRSAGMSFRTAHEIVSLAVKEADGIGDAEHPQRIIAAVERLSVQITGKSFDLDPQLLHRALDPRNFVEARRIPGGPARKVLEEAIAAAREKLNGDMNWIEAASAHIQQAQQLLKSQTQAFLASVPAV
jgi:argininosuccinate lyase